ncbi:MAG: type IV pilus modification protein PilV [Cocleimonas sp.]
MNKIFNNKSCNNSSIASAKQSGFSLIEIMVAALILSIGILGVASLQIVGLKGTQQSYMKQQAMSVVQNLTERMRSNKPGVFNDGYLLPNSTTFDCAVGALPVCSNATSNCSATDIATADKHNLLCGYKTATSSRTGGIRNIAADDISTFLDGKLTVACPNGCATGEVRITVNWQERQIGNEALGAADSLIVNTRISP